MLDISVNGYRIKWSGEAPKNLRTGEYILVKETLHGQWRGGVIRWIKQSTEKSGTGFRNSFTSHVPLRCTYSGRASYA